MRSFAPVYKPGSSFSTRAAAALVVAGISFSAVAAEVEPQRLTLRDTIQRVLDHNEMVQIRALEWMSSDKRAQAARGIFEPEFVGSVEVQRNSRENSVQQQVSLLSTPTFDERNIVYSPGLETLTPLGSKVRLGYTLRDLRNNLQDRQGPGRHEFETFAGVSVVQPLLKNGGKNVTMAAIRIAAGESELAFQEYRRQLMLILVKSETAYWDLFFSQEQTKILQDSVRIADTVLTDNKARVQTGKSSELEVLEAEAGVALRKARLKDGQMRVSEAVNRLSSLFSGAGAFTNTVIVAVDEPRMSEISADYFTSMTEALEWNPDYLSQRRQVVQENIRLAYAKNQRYPQLDLKGSFGLSGLGDNPADSFRDVEHANYHNWSVGVETRIPLSGGRKGRLEYEAAALRKKEAILSLKSVEVELSNAIDTSIRRVSSTLDSSRNYQQVVDFNKRLLDTELARLDLGKTDSRKVLEAEERLSQARSAVLESQVNYQKSLLEWDLVRGSVLRSRNLELDKHDLVKKTSSLMAGGEWKDVEFQLWMRQAGAEYDKAARESFLGEKDKLIQHLRKTMSELPAAEPEKGKSKK